MGNLNWTYLKLFKQNLEEKISKLHPDKTFYLFINFCLNGFWGKTVFYLKNRVKIVMINIVLGIIHYNIVHIQQVPSEES